MIIKIADFGLSLNIGDKDYYRLTEFVDVKLPLKWMALESLSDYLFSEMSDVVSGSMYIMLLTSFQENTVNESNPQTNITSHNHNINPYNTSILIST